MAVEAAQSSAPAAFSGGKLVLVTVAVSLAIFMNVLDTSIANVSIPTIAGDLGVSPSQGTWVITVFAVAMAIAVPITGWLARLVGEVKLFVASVLLFTLFSLFCGLAINFEMLLVGRVLQGAVAGPMIPLSQSLLLASYPDDKRGMANGIWGMTAVVGPVAGPILGGWITENINWSWIFYINIPVGLVAGYVSWMLLRSRETATVKSRVDVVGLALLIVGVGCLQVMLDQGNDKAWFESNYITTLAIVSAVALSFFVVWELTDDNPVVDLRLFKQRNFAVGTIAIAIGYMIFFGNVVIFPLWLQTQMGYTATWAGLAAASMGILAIICSPLVGRLSDKFDLRIIATIGFLIFSVISFVNASFNTQVSFAQLFIPRLAWGIGISCFFIPLIGMSLSGLPPNRIAAASGLTNFLRILGLGFGTSFSVTLWDRRETLHDSHLSEHVTLADPAIQHALATLRDLGLTQMQAHEQLSRAISHQAYMLATNDIFWVSGWIFLALLLLVWFARPPFVASKAVAAE